MFSFSRKCQQLLLVLSSTVLFLPEYCRIAGPVFPEPQTIVYKIQKGKHSAVAPFVIRSTNTLKFEETFNGSAVYQTRNLANLADINKLYGIADCGTEHHNNSARFG
ncbi:hypothetical protein [Pontibacter burrus]|uniref:Uncharacterized protein n=1 Tax=Pontibacter burrus TaxID=2704466 RepID=A0A6B3LYM8_9BACT|nr:hypothetical protein [Pontibacter burrus]NEM98868.1 hypothetical protein [Pontibacter burrus]